LWIQSCLWCDRPILPVMKRALVYCDAINFKGWCYRFGICESNETQKKWVYKRKLYDQNTAWLFFNITSEFCFNMNRFLYAFSIRTIYKKLHLIIMIDYSCTLFLGSFIRTSTDISPTLLVLSLGLSIEIHIEQLHVTWFQYQSCIHV
jgi:hypothetical protein